MGRHTHRDKGTDRRDRETEGGGRQERQERWRQTGGTDRRDGDRQKGETDIHQAST